jgi:hypothetical protein
MRRRKPSYLDRLADEHNIRPEFYDPEGKRYGTPTFPYHLAPADTATRRQLRAAGLAPGGHQPIAQILWKHRGRRRQANLYDVNLAVPKRVPTPDQLAAVRKALVARMTCPSCPPNKAVKDYCIPKSYGECWECHEAAANGSTGKEGAQRQRAADYEAEAC